MADAQKTKEVDLRYGHMYGGTTYGPGSDVEVPVDFPDDADEKYEAWKSANGFGESPQSPPGASGSGVVTNTDMVSASGHFQGFNQKQVALSEDELNEKTKDELLAMAEAKNLTVEGTGSNGNVTKADLVNALKAPEAPEA